MLSIWVLEYLAFGHWVAIAIVHLFLQARKDWDVNVKNLNLGSWVCQAICIGNGNLDTC